MLHYGMVGGGNGAFIGKIHRNAVKLTDLAQLTAGAFSRHMDKNLETAREWSVPEDRVYANYEEMAEAESKREDGIDFVSIVTPNNTHYAIAKCFLEHGIHVVCDKPLTLEVEEAEDLKRIADEKGLLFCVTYGYTGYPAVRQARDMIERGDIGDIIHVRVSHPEDWVIASVPQEAGSKLPWRFDPKLVGDCLCTADVGTHAEQLLVQGTGLHIRRLIAMFDTFPRYLPLETNTTCLLDLGDGIRGELWASQIATGTTCGAELYVIGSKGSLIWRHETPDHLEFTPTHGAKRILEAGQPYMTDASNARCYASVGHHDGFNEAFSNIYAPFMRALEAKKAGKEPDPNDPFPDINEGISGVKFAAACKKSVDGGNIWVDVD